MDALGITPGRGLTVTGGLPYFGGPGNNYTTHAIATVTDVLREAQGDRDDGELGRLGMATGLGWYITKHALGIYGSGPPPGGYHRGDTREAQAGIDASAVETALGVERAHARPRRRRHRPARQHRGAATAAPMIVRLPDGRQMAVIQARRGRARGGRRARCARHGRQSRGRRSRRAALPSGHKLTSGEPCHVRIAP